MIKKILLGLFCLTVFSVSAEAKRFLPEQYYQQEWCNEHRGSMEYRLPDGSRVDCLTEDYAVEVDFASKWAESIGQSLYYANWTAKKPGVVLIIEKKSDFRHYYKIRKICDIYGIKLWYTDYKKQPVKNTGKVEKSPFAGVIEYIVGMLNELVKWLESLA